jgi:hypothetical protein
MSDGRYLRDQVARSLPWLFAELGFSETRFEYHPRAFGDSFLVLDSAVMRLRFACDRGHILADVAPVTEPEYWWSVLIVLEALFGEASVADIELVGLGNLIRINYPRLVEALGPGLPETKRALDRWREQRMRTFESAAAEANKNNRWTFIRLRRIFRRSPVIRLLAWFVLAIAVLLLLRR